MEFPRDDRNAGREAALENPRIDVYVGEYKPRMHIWDSFFLLKRGLTPHMLYV